MRITSRKPVSTRRYILVITDGYIEHDLKIKREHAYLIPNGNKLPFRTKGKVFYMENKVIEH